MQASTPTRVLIVEHKASPTPELLAAVRERAKRGACEFTLLVPNPAPGLHKVVDPEDQGAHDAHSTVSGSLPALSEAAGNPVDSIVGDADPVAAVEDAINLYGFEEAIVSTPSPRLARWLKLDLASKVSGMGVTVTAIRDAGTPVAAAA